MRSHVGGGEEEENENSLRVWKSLSNVCVLKTEGTVSASGGLAPLQMVSELDTKQGASNEAEP